MQTIVEMRGRMRWKTVGGCAEKSRILCGEIYMCGNEEKDTGLKPHQDVEKGIFCSTRVRTEIAGAKAR